MRNVVMRNVEVKGYKEMLRVVRNVEVKRD
jgi:hypothetical protein